ncbi:hypothetical protein [Nocardiopsis sp. NPDC006832]|uniref:hypothetical protein n=1 Tax=Nocardiopsis sp. NPDC006832 TaxID=3157188 RepID=UPI0034050108
MREPERPAPETRRRLDLHDTDDSEEPDNARKVTFTIAAAVTILFLLITAAGVGWFLSRDDASTDPGDASGDASASQDSGEGGESEAGRTPVETGTVSDPNAGLAFQLPGEGWRRLGDDQVPSEYDTYSIHGSPEDPEAIIVTGTEELGPLEPLALTAVDMATDMVGQLVAEEGDLWIEPDGATEVDGVPAFGVTMGSDSGDGANTYGRFLVMELGGDQGAFMLGLNTGGGDEVTDGIDAAFDSVVTL